MLPDGSIGKPNSIKKDDKVSKSEKIPIALKGLGLGDRGYFLVVNQDDSADIVSTKAGNEVIWHFDNEVSGGAFFFSFFLFWVFFPG